MKKIVLVLLFSVFSLFAFENLTNNNFDQKIANKNVIIDFYSNWWGACKALGKSLTKYNTSKTQNVTIYKVKLADEEELAKRLNVYGMPTLVYIKNSKVIKVEQGVKTPEEIRKNLKKYLE